MYIYIYIYIYNIYNIYIQYICIYIYTCIYVCVKALLIFTNNLMSINSSIRFFMTYHKHCYMYMYVLYLNYIYIYVDLKRYIGNHVCR